MWKRQPYRAELKEAGSLRVDYAARNVDVRDGVSIKKHIAVSKIVKERKHRHECSDASHTASSAVARRDDNGTRGTFVFSFSHALALDENLPLGLARSIQMREFAENLKTRIDFSPRQILQTLGAKTLHGKRSHHASIE